MIDVHCHLFNALSLPLRGIFRSRRVPAAVAALLDAAVRALAERDDTLDPTPAGAASLGRESVMVVEPGELAPEPMSHEECIDWFVDRVPESLLSTADLPASVRSAADANATGAAIMEARREALAAYLKKDGFGTGSIGEAISFIFRLLKSERELFQELESISQGVQLFAYHTMDMEHSYADRPEYEYVRQLHRMRSLSRSARGRLVGFVAFEPFRPGAIRIVREALENGFCGVKFYPPSGYKPIGNTDSDLWPISGREIDRRNLELFTYCAENDVPILAHCTPRGFERVPRKTGRFSHPDLWADLLEHQRFRTLRVCLGHAGGEEGWFDEIPGGGGSGSFYNRYAGKIVKLCDRFPNVYCEFSHMDPVMTAEGRRRFAYWLNAAISRFPTFASKIMYGSDFPMLLDEGPWPDYRASMLQAFEDDPRLRRHKQVFFTSNALRFLDLPRFLRSNETALTDAEKTYLRSIMAGMTEPPAASAPALAGPAATGVRPDAGGAASLSPAPSAGAAVGAASMAAAASARSAGPGLTETDPVECIVLGAGIAGVTAARELMRNYFRRPNEGGADRSFSVLVLEATERVGGRMHTLRDRFPVPVELGAELIHRARTGGEDAVDKFWEDVTRYGLVHIPIDKMQNGARSALIYFDEWGDGDDTEIRPGCDACANRRFKAGLDALDTVSNYRATNDRTVADFIHDYIVRQRGYGEPANVALSTADYLLTGTVPGASGVMSAASLRFDRVREQAHSSEEYHVRGGYDLLPGRMVKAEQITVLHGAVVNRIEYGFRSGSPRVVVHTADGRRYHGKTAVCTFSVGFLKDGNLQFDPALPTFKQAAIDRVKLGPESKIVMQFKKRFWPRTMAILSNPGEPREGGRSYFVPGYPQSSAPVLTAFLTRSDADALDTAMPDGGEYEGAGVPANDPIRTLIVDTVLKDLEKIFRKRLQALNINSLDGELEDFYCRSWTRDPFARGATSYIEFAHGLTDDVATIRDALAQPTIPLFWAGEATAHNTQPWSVHGAHASGVRAAWQVRRYFVLNRL